MIPNERTPLRPSNVDTPEIRNSINTTEEASDNPNVAHAVPRQCYCVCFLVVAVVLSLYGITFLILRKNGAPTPISNISSNKEVTSSANKLLFSAWTLIAAGGFVLMETGPSLPRNFFNSVSTFFNRKTPGITAEALNLENKNPNTKSEIDVPGIKG